MDVNFSHLSTAVTVSSKYSANFIQAGLGQGSNIFMTIKVI